MTSTKIIQEVQLAPNSEETELHPNKKVRLMSMDTAESTSREESVFGSTPQKERDHDLPQSPDRLKQRNLVQSTLHKMIESGKPSSRSIGLHTHAQNEAMKNYMKDPSSYEDKFKVIKFEGNMYKLDSVILIKNQAGDGDMIAKLVKIIRPKKLDSNRILAFIEVQWYYKKKDLPKKFSAFLPNISESELFLTAQKDFILIELIKGPCKVITFEEYDSLKATPPNIFFSRATYDVVKKKLEPPIEQWNKHCICQTPMNPDLLYVQCDKCQGWYHVECIGTPLDEVEAADQYFCQICQDPETAAALQKGSKIQRRTSTSKKGKDQKPLTKSLSFQLAGDLSVSKEESANTISTETASLSTIGFFNSFQKETNKGVSFGVENQSSIVTQSTTNEAIKENDHTSNNQISFGEILGSLKAESNENRAKFEQDLGFLEDKKTPGKGELDFLKEENSQDKLFRVKTEIKGDWVKEFCPVNLLQSPNKMESTMEQETMSF